MANGLMCNKAVTTTRMESPALKSRFHLINILLAGLLLLLTIEQSSTKSIESLSDPFHVAWIDKQVRFDLVFRVNGPLEKDIEINSISQNSLAPCIGYSACLLQNGTLDQSYNRVGNKTEHLLTFEPIEKKHTDSISNPSSQGSIVIRNYCSTHWLPLVHDLSSGGNHVFDWHSPYSCPKETTNYEHPCYVYDSAGKLIDLTPWILSNGSSYKVDTGAFNQTIKEFNLNICNEANETCGHHVTSCHIGRNGHVESGYNNLTTISYNSTEKVATLTTLGQLNKTCTGERVRTVVKFVCKNKIIPQAHPKLVQANGCDNVIEWPTVHACPLIDISVPATNCTIKNVPWGIDIDLRKITNNQTSITVPNVMVNNTNHSMVLGLCRGISPKEIKCESRSVSTVSACLLKPGVKPNESNATNSNITGNIMKSSIRFTDNQVYLESFAINSTCRVPSGKFEATKKVGTRIEFFCSSEVRKPEFYAYEDCTYVFRWGSPLLCFESFNGTLSTPSSSHDWPSSSTQADPSDSHKTGHEKHIESLEDAKKMLEPQKDEKKVDNQVEKPSLNGSAQTSSTSAPKVVDVKPSNSRLDKKKVLQPASLPFQPVKPSARMNTMQKLLMSGLIMVVLVGFFVMILVLDKKTRLRIPLASIRGRARQVFQGRQQVPYTRVNRFNDSLDL